MKKLIDKAIAFCVTSIFICTIALIGIIGYFSVQPSTSQQYKIIVYNADGSINEIYQTNRYSIAGSNISFIDDYKGNIRLFNWPTIIKSQAIDQATPPLPQDRTAEEEGRKAEKAGKELKDNPYEKGTRKHSQWEAGWWASHDSFFGTS